MGHTTVLITTGWIKRAEVYFQCHFHIVASFCIMYIHLRSEFAHCFSLPKIALRFSEIRRHLKHCSSVLVFACIYISCLNMMVDTLVWCSQVTYYVTKAKERKESDRIILYITKWGNYRMFLYYFRTVLVYKDSSYVPFL